MMFQKMWKDKVFCFLFCVAVILIFIPIFASVIAPYDPIKNNYEMILKFYTPEHLLGTDQIGRDILSRLIYGGQTTLLIIGSVIFIVSTIGILLGVVSAYFGGIVDFILNGICEMVLALPETIFVIAFISVLGPSVPNAILAMSLIGWTEYMRVSRSLVLSIKEQQYVESGRMLGFNKWQILYRLVIPNIVPYLIVNMSQDIGSKILTLSGLSLLGLAAQPPTPEWGFMLSEGRGHIQSAPWMIIYPGIVIMIYVIVFNLLGDKIRDILDPKYKGRK